jgi:hypothetical protein
LRNHTDDAEEVNLYSSSQIHLDTPCNRLDKYQVL